MSAQLSTISTAVSEQIIGRKKELKIISEFLLNSEKRENSLLAVAGPPGIGKTRLLHCAMEQYSIEKGFKLYGKFENRDTTPYSAFKQAFSVWAQQILLLPDEDFDELKEQATAALQTNIVAVTAVFQELEVFFSRKNLIGNFHKVDLHQIQARFLYFFGKFLKSVTSLGYGIIIFLDDLQWADNASFLLLQEIVQKKDIPGLVFLISYRPRSDKEKNPAERIESLVQSTAGRTLFLRPLPRKAINFMIPSHWKFSKQNAVDFGNYLWLETGGDPFKITEILKMVQRENLVSHKPQDPLFWENLPKVNGGRDSVLFISERLRNLPFHLLKVLATASCIGYHFDAGLLRRIFHANSRELKKDLRKLVEIDLLIKKRTVYVFVHDTIFSAANNLLSNAEKWEIHQKAGIYLLQKLKNYEKQDFFPAVNHFNKAYDLSGSGRIYSEEHILLNIQAAKLALSNSALTMAQDYFEFANRLFTKNISGVRIKDPILISLFKSEEIDANSIRFHIYFGYAETAFLQQRFEAALNFARQVLLLNSSRHQRVKATLIQIRICSALIYQKNTRELMLEGLQSLEQVIGEFGIVFPDDPTFLSAENINNSRILYEKAANIQADTDFAGQINHDEEYQDLLKLITTSMTFLYYMDVRKNLYIALKTLIMVLEKGHAPISPILFSASFLTSFFSARNREVAHILGKLSLKMMEQEPFKRYTHINYYIATLNFFAWENHYKICNKKLKESIHLAYEAGDPHYAAFCSTNIRLLNCYRGKNLRKHLKSSEKLEKNHHIFFISSSDTDLANYLTGIKPGFAEGNFIFSEDLLKETEYNQSCSYHYHLALQKLYYIGGHFEAALQAGHKCEALENVYNGFQIQLEHYFFYSLSLLQLAFLNPEQLPQVLEKLEPKLEELKRLSAFRSGNFLHKVYLIEAEMAKCRADFEQATLLYDLAMEEARKQGFIHHAAIAAERASEYYRIKQRPKLAAAYLKKSLKYYSKWGAMAKVEQLKQHHPFLIEGKNRSATALPAKHFETIREILGRTVPGKKVSVSNLGEYLVSLLEKEGKAKKTGIVLFQQNKWKIVAIRSCEESMAKKSMHQLQDKLPLGILNYCIKTGEKFVLQDVSANKLFAADPYLKKEEPENLSLFPIKQSGETVGLIYLEDCQIYTETEKELFLVLVELASTTFANAVYYKNNEILNKELKLQERHRIEAIIESQEKERQRIARELHDSLGQILALSKITLSRIDPHSLEYENRMVLEQVSNLIDESCREVRTISHDLMPPDLDSKNLPEILENLINKNRQNNDVIYEFQCTGAYKDLSLASKFTLYRVLQEILQNIIKHASASKVNISLTRGKEFANLLVEDNGKGFDTKLTTLGIGLKNIHSRIKLMDGYLDIDSSLNNGTMFNVSIPLKS